MLNFDKSHLEFFFLDKFKILVDGLQTQIDGLWFVVFHEITLVGEQIFTRTFLIPVKEVIDSPHIRANRIRSQIMARKKRFEFCYHIIFN